MTSWNDGSPLARQFCQLADDEKRAVVAAMFKVGGDCVRRELVQALFDCDESTREKLREGIGCGCGSRGSKSHDKERHWCVGRRLSKLEEAQLRANVGGTVDIPTVQGAGGTVTVTVPAYRIEYFLREFSIDGSVSTNAGSLSKVSVQIAHAGTLLADFRASQYSKNSCCTTIVERFEELDVCFGTESTWTVTVTNNNANQADTFINGVLSFARGFPKK
jgi:hypothetical protein